MLRGRFQATVYHGWRTQEERFQINDQAGYLSKQAMRDILRLPDMGKDD